MLLCSNELFLKKVIFSLNIPPMFGIITNATEVVD